MRENRLRDKKMPASLYSAPEFRRERFGHEAADDSSWLISMSDLMSLLLVFFLVWTAINMAGHSRNGHAIKKQTATETQEKTPINRLHERMKGRLYELIPTNLKNSFVVVSFNHENSEEQSSGYRIKHKQHRAEAWLMPVDMELVSLE